MITGLGTRFQQTLKNKEEQFWLPTILLMDENNQYPKKGLKWNYMFNGLVTTTSIWVAYSVLKILYLVYVVFPQTI